MKSLTRNQVERKVLYHFMLELRECEQATDDQLLQSQLSVLLEYLDNTYELVRERVRESVDRKSQIAFGLLWALFKPNDLVLCKCRGTEEPRCIVFDSGKMQTMDDGRECFVIEGRYLDQVGTDVREASTVLGIYYFEGTKPIDGLDVFPLKYDPREKTTRQRLVKCGQKFQELLGRHHREYDGLAFVNTIDGIVKVTVRGRIMIDAALFWSTKPNYAKPQFNDATVSDPYGWFVPGGREKRLPKLCQADEDRLLVFSPTVLGFSLDSKEWRKCPLPADLLPNQRCSGVCSGQHRRHNLESRALGAARDPQGEEGDDPRCGLLTRHQQ
jgi:hypothetical protein